MDLEKLNAINTTKADEVKALQQFLKTRGYYSGEIDGKWGGKTTDGAGKLREDLKQESDKALKLEETRTAGKVAETEGKKAENDPINRLTKLGTEVLPYTVGAGAGTAVGHAFGKKFGELDKTAGKQVNALSNASDVDPTIKRSQMNRLMGGRHARNAAQFAAPGLLFGAGAVTRDVIAPSFSDPSTQDIIKSVATGENAAAGVLGVHQAASTLLRGNPFDATDVARIRSDALPDETRRVSPSRATPSPQAAPAQIPPQQADPEPPQQHSQRLKHAAAAAGAKPGKTKEANYKAFAKGMTPENMAEVAKALNLPADAERRTILQRAREMTKSGGKASWLLPLAAGGAAYQMTRDSAQAADGGVEGGQGDPLTAAAAAGGTAYGANKLLGALPKVAGAIGRMSGPMMLNDIATQAHRGIYGEGPQYLDVPEESPTRSVVTGQDSGSMESAAALQIPEGIPAPNPDGSSPYAAAEPEDFDTQLADLQRLFAELDQHDAPEPMQQAQQSQQVAQMPDPWQMASQSQNRLLGAR